MEAPVSSVHGVHAQSRADTTRKIYLANIRGFPFMANVTKDLFESYLLSLMKKDGLPLEHSSLNSHRSSFVFLYTFFEEPFPPSFAASLKEFF